MSDSRFDIDVAHKNYDLKHEYAEKMKKKYETWNDVKEKIILQRERFIKQFEDAKQSGTNFPSPDDWRAEVLRAEDFSNNLQKEEKDEGIISNLKHLTRASIEERNEDLRKEWLQMKGLGWLAGVAFAKAQCQKYFTLFNDEAIKRNKKENALNAWNKEIIHLEGYCKLESDREKNNPLHDRYFLGNELIKDPEKTVTDLKAQYAAAKQAFDLRYSLLNMFCCWNQNAKRPVDDQLLTQPLNAPPVNQMR